MKKFLYIVSVVLLLLLFCSCRVNWFTETYEVPWYYVVIPCVVLIILAYIFILSQTYICPSCKTEFKPKWYQIYTTIHFDGKRIAKCPNCGKKGYCEVKKNK